MTEVHALRDGTFEVYGPFRAAPEHYREFDELLARAEALGVVIRKCRDRDRDGDLRTVKFLLSVDPATLRIGD